MTNEQYRLKCEATRNFREVVAELETKKSASYSDYAAYYIIKHGLYRDVNLIKAFFDDQRKKTPKMKSRMWDYDYIHLFDGYTNKLGAILERALVYIPEEFVESVKSFGYTYRYEE